MARCHDCDRTLRGEPYWREVRVGSTRASGFAFGHDLVPLLGAAAHYERKPLCFDCASDRDAKDRRKRQDRMYLLLAVALVPLVGLLLFLATLAFGPLSERPHPHRPFPGFAPGK